MKKLGHGNDANYAAFTLAACNARDNDSDSWHLHAGVNAVVNLRREQ